MLSYWVEHGINTSSTRIWVKIPTIPAQSSVRLLFLYGNPNATTQSNLSNTFLAVIPNLLVAYSMDEPTTNTLVDKSGNNLHGTIYGAQWISGTKRYALQFNGTNSYVLIPELALENYLPLSVVTTLRHNAPSGDIVPRLVLGVVPTDVDYNIVRSVYGAPTKYATVGRKTATNTFSGARTTTSLTGNVWYHVAAIYTTAGFTIYLNGALQTTTSGTYTTPSHQALRVNAIGRFFDYYFVGALEGLRIYTSALTSTQVELLCNELPYETLLNTEAVGKTLVRRYAPQELVVNIGAEYEVNYNGWRWARQITVTNPNTSALTNYQILLTINTQQLISQHKMRADGGDIRFALLTDVSNITKVVVMAPQPPTGHMIFSAKESKYYQAAPPMLTSGVTQYYEMLASALTFAKRLVSALGRFVDKNALIERSADARGYIGEGVSANTDAQVWFAVGAEEARADARAPFGTEVERQADAHGYFSFETSEALADAWGALAYLVDKYPDARVYFGTIEDKQVSAQGVNVHISDVNKVAEFIANYLPQAWKSKEWSVTVVPLRRGAARKVTFPNRSGSNVLKGVLYIAAGEWWLEELPSDTQDIVVYNRDKNLVTAFVYCFVL